MKRLVFVALIGMVTMIGARPVYADTSAGDGCTRTDVHFVVCGVDGSPQQTSIPISRIKPVPISSAQAGAQALAGGTFSCIYYNTGFGSVSGDSGTIYGATSDLGAKAAASSSNNLLTPIGTQTKSAHATVGHGVIWDGAFAVNGQVVYPWRVSGTMDTHTGSSLFTTTSASGSYSVSVEARDTTGQDPRVTTSGGGSSGTALRSFSDSYQAQGFAPALGVNFYQNQEMLGLINLDVSASATGSLLNPLLTASSQVDFFGGTQGAYLSYVEFDFNLPSGYTVNCNA